MNDYAFNVQEPRNNPA